MALRELAPDELERLEAEYRSLPKSIHGKPVTDDEDVYSAAKVRIADCFARFDEVIVSWSAGKDSTVLMNLTLEVADELGRLPVHVRFWDEEALPDSVDDYARRLIATEVAAGRVRLEWLALPIQHRNACDPQSPNWWPWAPESRDLWCRPMPPEAQCEDRNPPVWWPLGAGQDARPSIPVCSSVYAATRKGTVGILLGLRAQESLRRHRIIVSKGGKDSYITHATGAGAANMFHVYPIYDWTQVDVWTAIGHRGWDYCTFYDHMEMLGVAMGMQRLGPPFGEEPLQRLWTYQLLDPPLWEKMAARVPGARSAALHSRNTLYGFGGGSEGGVDKGDDEDWPKAINRVLQGHDPLTLKITSQRLAGFINRHYRKTAEPILDVPHPSTGVSWPWLFRLALRGDVKARRVPPLFADHATFTRRWTVYHDELDRQKAAKRGTNGHG